MTQPRGFRRFLHAEDGAGTVLMLYSFAVILVMGGMALDIANRYRVETALQAAADMAAASAATTLSEPLRLMSPEQQARRTVADSLDGSPQSDAWQTDSFELGVYDAETAAFQPTEDTPDAVRVTLRRSPVSGNGEPTFLMRMIGRSAWDIRVASVARVRTMTALPCPDALLSAKALTRMGRGELLAGICIGGSAEVTTGDLPGWLTEDASDLLGGVLTRAFVPQDVIEDLTLTSAIRPEVALSRVVRDARKVTAVDFDPTTMRRGTSVHVSCPDNGVLRLRGPLHIDDAALLSDCPIRFDSDVSASASLILSNLAGLHPGRDRDRVVNDTRLMSGEGCEPGNGARLYLFASAEIRAAIPVLADAAGPLGAALGATIAAAGPVLSGLSASLSALTAEAEATVELGDMAGVCLGAEAMVSTDRVSLH